MKKLFIRLLGVMMSLPTFARDFIYEYEGQTLSYSVTSEEDKTVSVFKCDYLSGDLIIPSIAKDELTGTQYTVTSIGDNAFSICSSLASVNIPDAVTSIGDFAFSGCDNLISIVIPDAVTSIGIYAFSNCI